MVDRNPTETVNRPEQQVTHSVECRHCGAETYEFEKYCHVCGEARW